MGGPSRRAIFGPRISGAKIHVQHAREEAEKAIRKRDAAECLLWSEQMEGYGGPAQPSTPEWRLRLARGEVPSVRIPGQHSPRRGSTPARYRDLEAGGRVPLSELLDEAL